MNETLKKEFLLNQVEERLETGPLDFDMTTLIAINASNPIMYAGSINNFDIFSINTECHHHDSYALDHFNNMMEINNNKRYEN